MPICARAGGGSGGGGSGGGGGSSHHFHYHHNGSSSSSSMDGIIFATTFIGTGILLHVLSNESYYKAVYRSRKELKERYLDAKAMYKQMTEKYYIIQQAWSDVDLDTLKKECSPQLYDQWRVKLEWQENRNERNVLENIRLIRMRIVKVNKKSVWVYVKGKMKDSLSTQIQVM